MKKVISILAVVFVLCMALAVVAMADAEPLFTDGGANIDPFDGTHQLEMDAELNVIKYLADRSRGFKAATCTENGYYYVHCLVCPDNNGKDAYHYVTIPATGHLMASEVLLSGEDDYIFQYYGGQNNEYVTLPTCTTQGEIKDYCVRCVEYMKENPNDKDYKVFMGDTIVIDALGHKYTEAVITKAATCKDMGTLQLACGRACCAGQNVLEKTVYSIPTFKTLKYVEVEKDVWVSALTLALRANPNLVFYREEGAGANAKKIILDDYLADADGHVWSAWKVDLAATCWHEGSKSRTCNICSTSESEIIPMTEHNFKKITTVMYDCETLEEVYECQNEGCNLGPDGGPAVLNVPLVDVVAHNWKLVKTVDATCTAKGYKLYVCVNDRCPGNELGDNADIQAEIPAEYAAYVGHAAKKVELAALKHTGSWTLMETFTGEDGQTWTKWTMVCTRDCCNPDLTGMAPVSLEQTVVGTNPPAAPNGWIVTNSTSEQKTIDEKPAENKPAEKPADADAPAPVVTLAEDGKSAKVEGNTAGKYVRVAITTVTTATGETGLIITQGTLNEDGTVFIPTFLVPGVELTGVMVTMVDDMGALQSTTYTAVSNIAFVKFAA